MKRDPHLPPPEVCDWLLSQEWSKPSTVHIGTKHHKGYINDCRETSAAVGRDETIDLLLPSFGLQILQEDAVARQADAYEASGLTPEQQLVEDIRKVVAASGLSAIIATGALASAAMLWATAAGLITEPDQEAHQ